MKKRVLTITLALLFLSLVSCKTASSPNSNQLEQMLLGQWYQETKTGNKNGIYFYEDGTCVVHMSISSYTDTWNIVEENTLKIIQDNKTYTATIESIDKDTLVLDGSIFDGTFYKITEENDTDNEETNDIEQGLSNKDSRTSVGTDGLKYKLGDNGTYEITGYDGTESDVVVPDTYEDIPVTGMSTYGGGFFGNHTVKSILFGKNFHYVISSFASCYVEKIEFTSDSIEIPGNAYLNDIYLTDVIFADNCTITLGEEVFDGCSSLEEIDFSNAASCSISALTFNECKNLKKIVVPKNTTFSTLLRPEYMLSSVNETLVGCDAEIVYV